MVCPNCKVEFLSGKHCPSCNVDVFLYKGILRISDGLYNKGLALAKNSDLTGAIECLTKSVEINKNNVRARNLLGLTLFEVGHVGDALKHWVISQSLLKSEDNPANSYIQRAQESGRTLERLSDALNIYNQSLEYIRQKSDDLAIIQLKKAIEINPKFVDALNLLALCYLIQGDHEKASRMVEKVLLLDIHNTVALNYYAELYPSRTRTGPEARARRSAPQVSQTSVATPPPANYTRIPAHNKTTNFHIAEILSFIIGAVLMFAVMYGLVVQAVDREGQRKLEEAQTKNADTIKNYQDLIEQYEQDIAKSDQLINELKSDSSKSKADLDLQERTNRVLSAYGMLLENRYQEAVNLVDGLVTDGLDSDIIDKAEEIYSTAYPLLARQFYDDGVAAERAQDFTKALIDFQKSYKYIDEEVDYYRNLLYYLASLYARNDDTLTQARDHLNTLVTLYPNFNQNNVSRLLRDVEEAIGE